MLPGSPGSRLDFYQKVLSITITLDRVLILVYDFPKSQSYTKLRQITPYNIHIDICIYIIYKYFFYLYI